MPAYLDSVGLLARPAPPRWTLLRCGFPYWNLSAVKAGLRRIPGFCERDFDADLGIASDDGGEARTALSPRTLLAGLRTLFGIRRSVRRRLRAAPAVLKDLDALLDRLEAVEPDALGLGALADHVDSVLARHHRDCETLYFTTIYDNSNAATLFRETLAKRNRDRRRRGLEEHDYLSLAGGLSDVPHLVPVRDLWQVSRRLRAQGRTAESLRALGARETCRLHLAGISYPGEEELRSYLRAHRHRSLRELDLLTPCWDEDPLPVFENLLRLLACEDDEAPDRQEERSQARYRSALAGLDRGLRSELAVHRAMLSLREQMRERSTRMYRLVRVAALALGRRLHAAGLVETSEAVMHLPFPELIVLARAFAVAGSNATVAGLLASLRRRRDYHLGFRNYPRPDEIMPRRTAAPVGESSGGLRGIVCSPGIVEAPVRVLDSVDQADQVRDGEILVTAYTDPAWTPLFRRIAGLITETGGVLSHGAVVSREYGIPAVLGVKGARRTLRTGMRVRLDGETGTITPLSEARDEAAE